MSEWRVIMTDSESMTGVAPVCETDHTPHSPDGDNPLTAWVFDCCPWPHIEVWSEAGARIVAEQLSLHDAKQI